MAFKNFKVETDADGIVLVTWDIPGRSMNVLDETSINELEEIVKQTSADAAVKGVVITSAKEAFCAGADLSMLEGMNQVYAKIFKEQGEEAANQMLFDQSRRFSQVLRFIQAFEIDNSKINVNGGAIALGHPLGATGAMILGTVLDELERANKSTALVTLCIGGGMGTATIIERV